MGPPKKILIHTGNILDSEELVRKVGQTTQEEVSASVATSLSYWAKENSNNLNEDKELLVVRGLPQCVSAPENIRGLKTTVKVFMTSCSEKSLDEAVRSVINGMSREYVESVIIVPSLATKDLTLSLLKPVWQQLEALVKEELVYNIGVADICPIIFMELYEWATIKPSTIQLNMSNCCTISEELSEFANLNEIQILTHNDDAEIFAGDLLDSVLKCLNLKGSNYEISWMARCRSVQTYYGVVTCKGYSMGLSLI